MHLAKAETASAARDKDSATRSCQLFLPRHSLEQLQADLLDVVQAFRLLGSCTGAEESPAAATFLSWNRGDALLATLEDSESPLYLVVHTCRAFAYHLGMQRDNDARTLRLILHVLCDTSFEGCLVNDDAFWRTAVFEGVIEAVGLLANAIARLPHEDAGRQAMVAHVVDALLPALDGPSLDPTPPGHPLALTAQQRQTILKLTACLVQVDERLQPRALFPESAAGSWQKLSRVVCSALCDRDFCCRMLAGQIISAWLKLCEGCPGNEALFLAATVGYSFLLSFPKSEARSQVSSPFLLTFVFGTVVARVNYSCQVESSLRPALERGRDNATDDADPHIHDMNQHKLRGGYELEQHRATAVLLLVDIQPYVPQVCARVRATNICFHRFN